MIMKRKRLTFPRSEIEAHAISQGVRPNLMQSGKNNKIYRMGIDEPRHEELSILQMDEIVVAE